MQNAEAVGGAGGLDQLVHVLASIVWEAARVPMLPSEPPYLLPEVGQLGDWPPKSITRSQSGQAKGHQPLASWGHTGPHGGQKPSVPVPGPCAQMLPKTTAAPDPVSSLKADLP